MTTTISQAGGKKGERSADARHIERVREILATVKPLAAEYYRLTGKRWALLVRWPNSSPWNVWDSNSPTHEPPAMTRSEMAQAVLHSSRSKGGLTEMAQNQDNALDASKPTQSAVSCFWCFSTMRRSTRAKCGRRHIPRFSPASLCLAQKHGMNEVR